MYSPVVQHRHNTFGILVYLVVVLTLVYLTVAKTEGVSME